MTRGQRTTQATGSDGHFAPDFEYWRRFATLKVWEIAYLMMGVDPRHAAEYVEGDPENPTDQTGAPPDTSDDVRRLASAIDAELLKSTGSAVDSAPQREVVVESLIPWLMTSGHALLAEALRGATLTRAERCAQMLARLRELGGDVVPDRQTDSGFGVTGIKVLKRDLQQRGQPLDDKTIRSMLHEAAGDEAERRRAGELESAPTRQGGVNDLYGFGPRK